jgi:uncharacterized protein YkvS
MEREFKVGERVKIIKSSAKNEIGMTGLITLNDGSGIFPLTVVLDLNDLDFSETICNHNELELIEEPKKNTTTTFLNNPIECISIKDTRLERLEDLLKAVNVLGSLGLEVALKITVEFDGKKIEL